MSQSRKPWIKVILIGLVLGVVVLVTENIFSAETTLDILRILTDAFTVPGLLLMGAAGLGFAAERGALDGLGYGMHRAVGRFIPGASDPREEESFYDYVERKREEKSKKGSGMVPCLFFTGLAFFLVSLVLLVVYFCNKG